MPGVVVPFAKTFVLVLLVPSDDDGVPLSLASPLKESVPDADVGDDDPVT